MLVHPSHSNWLGHSALLRTAWPGVGPLGQSALLRTAWPGVGPLGQSALLRTAWPGVGPLGQSALLRTAWPGVGPLGQSAFIRTAWPGERPLDHSALLRTAWSGVDHGALEFDKYVESRAQASILVCWLGLIRIDAPMAAELIELMLQGWPSQLI